MITLNMIVRGLQTGIISLVVDPNMEYGTVCQIGDSWFYFGGLTAEEENPDEYKFHVPFMDYAHDIYETLYTLSQDPVLKYEYDYYESILKKTVVQLDTLLTLNICHINKHTADVLTRMADNDEGFEGLVVYAKDDVGFYLYPATTPTFDVHDNWPKGLRDICKLANEVSATIVCLDRDGAVVSGLIEYNW